MTPSTWKLSANLHTCDFIKLEKWSLFETQALGSNQPEFQ